MCFLSHQIYCIENTTVFFIWQWFGIDILLGKKEEHFVLLVAI